MIVVGDHDHACPETQQALPEINKILFTRGGNVRRSMTSIESTGRYEARAAASPPPPPTRRARRSRRSHAGIVSRAPAPAIMPLATVRGLTPGLIAHRAHRRRRGGEQAPNIV